MTSTNIEKELKTIDKILWFLRGAAFVLVIVLVAYIAENYLQ